MKKFEGKVAIVTGAGSFGMGYHIAKMLAAEGAKVVVNDYSILKDRGGIRGVDLVVDEIKAAGGEAIGIHADVTKMENNKLIVDKAIETYGKIDILMCVAGIIRYHSVPNIDESEWDFVMNVNSKSPYALCKYAIPYMKEQGSGNIVIFASNSAFGFGGSASYSAAKGAALSFTEALGMEVHKYGIKVNAILPSAITTLFSMDRIAWAGLPKPDPATPDMIAPMACYLASDDCPCFGEAFYVGGPDVGLYPRDRRVVGLMRKGNGGTWTMDELKTMVPETFQWYFDTMICFDADPDVVPGTSK